MGTISTNLGLQVPSVNADTDTWGAQLNASLATLDRAVQFGGVTKPLSNADVTLSADEAAKEIITLNGNLLANVNLIIPATPQRGYVIVNNTTGAFNVTVKTATGTGVQVPQGISSKVFSTGLDIQLETSTVPTGSLMMWATNTAPMGYLLCNGAAVSRTTFAALFAILGTTFGAGDGSITFNLPDYRDRMPIGAGTTYALNAKGGNKDATLPAHTHTATSTVSDPGHTHGYLRVASGTPQVDGADAASFVYQLAVPSTTSSNTTGISVGTTVASAGSSATNANLPPYIGIQFIIKA